MVGEPYSVVPRRRIKYSYNISAIKCSYNISRRFHVHKIATPTTFPRSNGDLNAIKGWTMSLFWISSIATVPLGFLLFTRLKIMGYDTKNNISLLFHYGSLLAFLTTMGHTLFLRLRTTQVFCVSGCKRKSTIDTGIQLLAVRKSIAIAVRESITNANNNFLPEKVISLKYYSLS